MMKISLRRRMESEYTPLIVVAQSGDHSPSKFDEYLNKKSDTGVNGGAGSWVTRVARRLYRWVKPKRKRTASSKAMSGIESNLAEKRKRELEVSDEPRYKIAESCDTVQGDQSLTEFDSEKANFFSSYRLVKPLNEGTFSKVYLALHKFTEETVAVKKIEKEKLKEEMKRTYLEIEALKSMDHPHICKLYQVFETEKYILIVLERCKGDLFDIIHKHRRLKEKMARNIFRQIVVAVDYIHSRNFAHRDLKPENVLFDQNGNVKLIDFNLSARIHYKAFGWNKLKTHCGTIEYAAPELVRPDTFYEGPPVDCWSLGVVLYTMLCGKFPFEGPDQKSKILNGVYEIPTCLSKESRHLIQHLLQINPRSRLTPTQILTHLWFTSKLKKIDAVQALHPFENILDKEILELMSQTLCISKHELEHKISENSFTSNEQAIYKIITRKKEIMGVAQFELWKIKWRREKEDKRCCPRVSCLCK